MRPDYKRIYLDILQKKYPEKLDECKPILLNDNFSSIDINKLNEIILEKKQRIKNLNLIKDQIY